MQKVSKELDGIQALFTELKKGRQEYDFQLPTFASHVENHANHPERLRRYARQVVNGRIMILLASSRITTQALLQTYLGGIETKTTFAVLLAARAQLELYSVVADTVRIIKENSGEHEQNFAQRVRAVDTALITATFGTRSSLLKQIFQRAELSKLRATKQEDLQALSSKNILTRLEKLARSGAYPECMGGYERLCEYVHPNWGMSMLHTVSSPVNPQLCRFSMISEEPFGRALVASAGAMYRAAKGTVSAFDTVEPPFGIGQISYIE